MSNGLVTPYSVYHGYSCTGFRHWSRTLKKILGKISGLEPSNHYSVAGTQRAMVAVVRGSVDWNNPPGIRALVLIELLQFLRKLPREARGMLVLGIAMNTCSQQH